MSVLKRHKELFILIGVIFCFCILIELPSWANGKYFVSGGDIKTQWYPFYVANRRLVIDSIRDGSMPFYSWILFLGNNIWSSMMSYGFVDVFNIIFYLFKKEYFFIFDIQFILKTIVGGLGAFFLIDYSLNNKKAAFFSGALFSLSSYALYFSSQSSFQSFAVFVPYYLLGIVKYIKEKKKTLFIFSTSLLFITNYYLFFSVTILSPFIFAYIYINHNRKIEGLFLNILKMILYYLIGFLITGVFTLPAFLYIMQNDRVGGFSGNIFSFSNLKVYLHIINSLFVPNELVIYGNNIFNFNEHTLKELCLFSSSLVVIIIPQVIKSKDKIFKYSSLLMYLLFAVILIVPILGSLLNGLSEVCFRWTHIFILFNIYIFSYIYFVEKNISKKMLIITSFVVSLIVLASFFICIYISKESIGNYSKQLLLIVIVILYISLFTIFIKNNKAVTIILLSELLLYSVLFGFKSIPTGVSKKDLIEVNSVLSDKDSDSIKTYLNSLEENNCNEFYRTYVDYGNLYWSFSRNMNLLYGIEGVMSYSSTFEPSFSDMLRISENGIVKYINWEYSIDDPYLLNFLSCKYALTLSEDAIPFNNYEIIDDNYRGGILVSKNLDYEKICSTYSKRKNTEEADFVLLKDFVVSNDTNIDQYFVSTQKNVIENVQYYANQLKGEIYSDEKSFAVLKISYDDGFRLKINDKDVPIYKCNGGMIGFPVEKGENNIEITFVPYGFKIGFFLSIIGVCLFAYVILKENYLSKKTA